MSRITGSEVASLMEAYSAVYAPQELTEEQIWEEVETWVNSLLEEGYDLSEYTWEEMYESYLSEMGQPGGNVPGGNRPISNAPYQSRFARPMNAGTPQRTGRGTSVSRPQIGSLPSNYRGQELQAAARANASQVRPTAPRSATPAAGAPAPAARPAAGAPAAAARPAAGAPAAAPTGGAGKVSPTLAKPPESKSSSSATAPTAEKIKGGMEVYNKQKSSGDFKGASETGKSVWALANPKLAAAAAEKARIRGTSQSDNPLMKGMPGKRPMTPSVQSPTLAKDLGGKGLGNQSLLNNPNASKAATPPPAAKVTPAAAPARNGFGVSAAPIAARASVGNITAPEVKATNKIAAAPKSTPVAPTRAPSLQRQDFDVFDAIKGHLLDEGYADTEEAALKIMANMSEEWRQSILMNEGVLGAVGKVVGGVVKKVGNYLNSPSNDPDLKRDPSYNPKTGKGNYKDPRKQSPKPGEVRTY